MASFKIKSKANLRSLDKLQRNIERGINDATPKIEKQAIQTAQRRIRLHDAIWKPELIESFDSETVRDSKGWHTEIWNYAEHAPYVERGARYTVRKPPLSALLPWVESKLHNYEVRAGADGEPVLRAIYAD